ncbi:NAD(P)H-dependent flavin oxidoreductase [Govanella unica]|uniref:Nitronate monooxygenase n=1 Tax=Govanella unica TaxID=2975056 RepID=A0A9X3Z6T0_9PROT|nr:nitronate monooxygenase family protein [Govania unica]MDA5193515.1 nitronate monooxygenase family protein [Govania unica]
MWPDRRILDLLGIELPILQAPMAGSNGSRLAIAVAGAGGLGAIPCALLGADKIRGEVGLFRAAVSAPINLNFFCHQTPAEDPARAALWRGRLAPYYAELGLDVEAPMTAANRAPFDATFAALIEELRPEVVSFHFGLPEPQLLDRVRRAGAKILSSATTVAEARWLADHGADAVIAQGAEAGGHRGMFLTSRVASQVGTFALVPQVVDAVALPVIAAGGVADARGLVAALALGAAAVQIGTAYLRTPEAATSAIHRAALGTAGDDQTAITNIFTGRPARALVNRLLADLGPLSDLAPEFPAASTAILPLRAAAESQGSGDFSSLWAGQAVALTREQGAAEFTRALAAEALDRLQR